MIQAILIISIVLLVSYISGHFLAAPFLNGKNRDAAFPDAFTSVFLKLFSGLLAIISVYALVKTRGNSILLGIPMLALLYTIIQLKSDPDLFRRKAKFQLIPGEPKALLFAFGSAIVCGIYLGLYYYAEPINNVLHFDEGYYAFSAGKLGYFGVETNDTIIPALDFNPASPYHYPETWLSYLLYACFGTFPMENLSVIVKSCFIALLYMGMLGIVNRYTRNFWFLLLAFPAMYISPILLDYENIKQASANAHQAKLAIASAGLVWMLLLKLHRRQYWYFPMLVLPFINILYAPVMFSALFIYMAVSAFIRKTPRKILLQNLFLLLCPALFIALFYGLQPKSNPYYIQTELDWFMPLYHLPYFIKLLYNYIKNYILYLPYFTPALLFAAWLYLKNKNAFISSFMQSIWSRVLFLLILYIGFGYVYEVAFAPFLRENAAQVNLWVNNLFLNILVFTLLTVSFVYLKKTAASAGTAVLFFGLIICGYNTWIYFETRNNLCFSPYSEKTIYTRYSKEHILAVSNYVKAHPDRIIGVRMLSDAALNAPGKMSSRSELPNGYWFAPFSTSIPFMYITNINLQMPEGKPDPSLYDLTSHTEREWYWWEISKARKISQNPIYYFYMSNQERLKDWPESEIQAAFILENNIGFIAADADVEIPESVVPYVDVEFRDEISGESIYFLKKTI